MIFTMFQDLPTVIQVFAIFGQYLSSTGDDNNYWVYVLIPEVNTGVCNLTRQGRLQKTTTTTTCIVLCMLLKNVNHVLKRLQQAKRHQLRNWNATVLGWLEWIFTGKLVFTQLEIDALKVIWDTNNNNGIDCQHPHLCTLPVTSAHNIRNICPHFTRWNIRIYPHCGYSDRSPNRDKLLHGLRSEQVHTAMRTPKYKSWRHPSL